MALGNPRGGSCFLSNPLQAICSNLLCRLFDPLPSTNSVKTSVRSFVGQLQECLLEIIPQECLAMLGLGHQSV